MNPDIIKIKASFIIAFDGKSHRYIKDGELVYQGADIIYVGKRYEGDPDQTIDATGKILSPGLISTHAHLYESPMDRSFVEDIGNPQFFYSGLYELLPVRGQALDRDMCRLILEFSMSELLRNGTTTVVEIGPYGEDVVSLIPRIGNRVYMGQRFRSARWYTPDGKRVHYEWNEKQGLEKMEEAVQFSKKYEGAHDGLLKTILCPSQVDTCSESLLMRSQEAAQKLDIPISIHVSQAVVEFQEMLSRHGKTPIGWLRNIGFLQKNVILGHAIILGGGSWTNYPPGDLEIIAESKCSVAHSPWVFARRGMLMESFAKYLKAGINMSLGTDTCPQNMIHAMRWAAVLSKAVERNTNSTTAKDVFNAATLGGATALGRQDLGRLAPGAKADIVIFSARRMNMVPLRDPVKNIVYNAEMEDVDTVIINGKVVLENGKVKGTNEKDLIIQIQKIGEQLWPKFRDFDWAKRSVDELSPLTYKVWDQD